MIFVDSKNLLSRFAARKYARIVQKLGFPAKFKDFKIQASILRNSHFDRKIYGQIFYLTATEMYFLIPKLLLKYIFQQWTQFLTLMARKKEKETFK
jgi:hypothetical protein